MLTLRQKWELVYGLTIDNDCMDNIIPANLLPSSGSAECIKQKNSGFSNSHFLQHPWQIFQLTDQALRDDFYFLTQNRESAKLPAINKTISPENIFIEEGAKVGYATLNASTGPIYISKNAEIMEGAMIRGPFFLGEESVVKMGSTIYGATSVGKKCTVGGEIKNAVFFDYSNKAHAGYLGDSVIGSWCNIGAGTSNSNLKNTASDVRAWSEKDKQYVSAGVKCGLLMGDYSRCAINTSFNTGTVTGVCC
ncbi:MAG: glucose-1-phosphate thymidylyltransferase, partial [Bacteroidetes bacterium]|nr:glucose-1-phosphate thymidylyltransferase [Bacteroidota bacterium]